MDYQQVAKDARVEMKKLIDRQVAQTRELVLSFIAPKCTMPSVVIKELHFAHRIKENIIREAIWQLLDEGKIVLTEDRHLGVAK